MAAFVLKCPACEKKFKYDVSGGWPDFCPMCAHKMGNDRPDDEIVCPAFLSQKSKNNDAVARQIMDGSETRAQMAAEMAGVPVSEMSGLKITNLNDRNDTQFSAPEVHNPVTERMDAMAKAGMPTGFGTNASDAMARAAAAHTGDTPYAGLRERNRMQRLLPPIGQAPLPKQISENPNYRSPV